MEDSYVDPVSVIPTLSVFLVTHIMLKALLTALLFLALIPQGVVFPLVIVMLLINCFYAIEFFIKKHKRYFFTSELLILTIGSLLIVWFAQSLIDGVIFLRQSFVEALINSSGSLLLQLIPVVFAYTYLGKYLLHRMMQRHHTRGDDV